MLYPVLVLHPQATRMMRHGTVGATLYRTPLLLCIFCMCEWALKHCLSIFCLIAFVDLMRLFLTVLNVYSNVVYPSRILLYVQLTDSEGDADAAEGLDEDDEEPLFADLPLHFLHGGMSQKDRTDEFQRFCAAKHGVCSSIRVIMLFNHFWSSLQVLAIIWLISLSCGLS